MIKIFKKRNKKIKIEIKTKFFNLVLQMNKKETIIFIKVFNKMMNFIIILKMNKNKIYSNQNKIIIN